MKEQLRLVVGRVKTEVASQRRVIRHACGVSALSHPPVTPLYLKASEPIFVNVTGSNRISSSAPYKYRVDSIAMPLYLGFPISVKKLSSCHAEPWDSL